MRSRPALALAALVAGGIVGFLPSSPAQAYVDQAFVEPVTLVDTQSTGVNRATLRLAGLAAGEARNLRSEISVGDGRADGSASRIAIGQRIVCVPVGGTSAAGQIANSRNLLADLAFETLVVRFLFVAPTAGDYDCHLRAYVNDGLALGRETARLRSGFLGDIRGTIAPGTHAQILNGAPDTVLSGGAGAQLHAVTYTPPAGTTSFQVTGDIYVSSCYDGPTTCGDGRFPDPPGTSRVYSRVVATPSSTAPGCASVASPARTVSVSNYVHHLRIMHQSSVTVPSAGCGSWRLNLFARDEGGTLPFVVHTASQYSVVYASPAP